MENISSLDNDSDISYFERSSQFHDSNTNGNSFNAILDYDLLNEGIELECFVSNQKALSKKHFYSEECNAKEIENKLKELPDKYIICTIHIEYPNYAFGIPVSPRNDVKRIEIIGRSKAGQTFTGDEAVVELLNVEKENYHHENVYGKVLRRVSCHRINDMRKPVFVCVLDDKAGHVMIPLCKSVPKIHIFNSHAKRESSQQKSENVVDVYSYNKTRKKLVFDHLQIVPDENRDNFVFVVVFITWNRHYQYPLGAVVQVLTSGTTDINTSLMVLDAMHAVPNIYEKQTVENVYDILSKYDHYQNCVIEEDRVDCLHLHAFTVDPDNSIALDDALSIDINKDRECVGIHVTDVTTIIKKNDPIDMDAQKRMTTFYSHIGKPRRLLPEPLSEDILSLLPKKKRNCLSVFFYFDKDGEMIGSPNICKTIIQSRAQISYVQVQEILESKSNNCDPTITSIQRLFEIATMLRKKRLGNAMFAIRKKDSATFEANILVEEFMILTNKYVAEKLLTVYPKEVPLLCQSPLSNAIVEKWWNDHEGVVDVLLCLQDRLLMEDKQPSFEKCIGRQDNKVVHISDEFVSELRTNQDIDVGKVSKMMRIDELHPSHFIALHEWFSKQNRTTYKCSSKVQNISTDAINFNLNVYPYTYFTSPIRRYVDMVVHRMVHCMLRNEPSCYTQQDCEIVCCNSNNKISRTEIYEEKCKALIVADRLRSDPKLHKCIIMDVSDEGIILITYVWGESLTFMLPFKLLDITKNPNVSKDETSKRNVVSVEWRKRLYDRQYRLKRLPYKDYTKTRQIDYRKESAFVPIKDWANGLDKLVHNKPDELTQVFRGIIANCDFFSYAPDCENIVRDVSTEEFRDRDAVAPYTSFSTTFYYGQIIIVQLSAYFQKGLCTLRPQIFEMTDNIHFCLHHTDDPVKWLYGYSKLPTIPIYKCMADYKRRWIPLVLMEAAVLAVNEEGSYVINNLKVKFTTESDEFCGRFRIPLKFCRDRNIILDRRDYFTADDKCDDRMKHPIVNRSYDWLCVRSKVKTLTKNTIDMEDDNDVYWIAHGKITSVKPEIKETGSDGHDTNVTYSALHSGNENARKFISVDFKLNPDVPPIPTSLQINSGLSCSVELLIKSDVDRRTESCLEDLDTASELAKAIALGRLIPRLDPEHIRASYLSTREVPFTSLYKNNPNQNEAIDKALSSAFSLIQGPPGTGKSYSAIKLIYLFSKINSQVKKREQVVFCGPSNKSVDNIASWMINYLKDDCPDIVRLYGRSVEALEYPIPGAVFTSERSMRDLKADPSLDNIAVHHLIRKPGKPFAKEIAEFDRKFNDKDYIPHYDEVSKYRSLIFKATVEEIRKHEIILCTIGVATSPKLIMGSNIYQLIIDEAGMCKEPLCMASLISTQAKQVVLIGDHKQLQPIIKCKSAAKLGLIKSLFERYAEDLKLTNSERDVQFTFLNTQYRMHPKLCEFPSHEFYDKKLETDKSVLKRDEKRLSLRMWPAPNLPHVFCHVEGKENIQTVSTKQGNEKSRSNEEEVNQVVKIFKHMVEVENLNVKDIHVISQYNAQCHALRQAFIKEKYENVTVNTVVASQGGEWDYVIFSTVRSLPVHQIESNASPGWCAQNLGFIIDRHQINVALTRAKRGLIIVGNKNLLMCDSVWKALLQRYRAVNCVVSPLDFPTRCQPSL